MCLSLPGAVIETRGPEALVETAGTSRWCNALFFPELVTGDRVLVHAGRVIELLTAEEASEIEETFAQLLALDDQG